MAGASNLISIDVNDSDIQRVFGKIQHLDQNMAPLFADIGEHLLESTKQRFADQVDPDGLAWQPLKESTRERKEKNSDMILVEHGQLMDSFHAQASSSEAVVGSNDIRAASLHFGDDNRNIPARNILGLNAHDQDSILDLAEDFLHQALL